MTSKNLLDKNVRRACTIVLLCLMAFLWSACAGRQVQGPDSPLIITLDGGTDHKVVSIFGAVIGAAPGVKNVRMVSSKLVPDSPQTSSAVWHAEHRNADIFAVQTAIMDSLDEIIDTGGSFKLQGKAYSCAAPEIALLKGIRPDSATGRHLRFVVDRERMRDQEFFGR